MHRLKKAEKTSYLHCSPDAHLSGIARYAAWIVAPWEKKEVRL
jgi:hypothetical protein